MVPCTRCSRGFQIMSTPYLPLSSISFQQDQVQRVSDDVILRLPWAEDVRTGVNVAQFSWMQKEICASDTRCFAFSAQRPCGLCFRLSRLASCARALLGLLMYIFWRRRSNAAVERTRRGPFSSRSPVRLPFGFSSACSRDRPGNQCDLCWFLIFPFPRIGDLLFRPVSTLLSRCWSTVQPSSTPRNIHMYPLCYALLLELLLWLLLCYHYYLYSLETFLLTFIVYLNCNQNKLKYLLLYNCVPYLNSYIPFSLNASRCGRPLLWRTRDAATIKLS